LSFFKARLVVPDSSLGSIFDFLSSILNMDAVADFALLESGAMELDWQIPAVPIVNAKKT